LDERLLDRVLREVEVAQDPDQGRDRPPLLRAEQAVDDPRRFDLRDGTTLRR
jgi:hypothetical protein